MKKNELKEISELSSKIGNDLDLIQGAGGNTSEKKDNILWVKASGCWLSDALEENIFVPVRYKNILMNIDNKKSDPVSSEVVNYDEIKNLRPSIETTLHAVMPYKYVVHTHSINSIVNTITKENLALLSEKLDNLNWSLVQYAKPGLPLAKQVKAALKPGIGVILMANHGVVIGSDSIQELEEKIVDLENRLKMPLRKIRKQPKLKELQNLVKDTDYSIPNEDIVHSLALDESAINAISVRSLYPDHLVFLGPGPMNIYTIGQASKALEKKKDNPEVLIIENYGVIAHKSRNLNTDLMLYCLASTLLRINPNEEIIFLTKKDEADLLGWDAEDYRIALQKNRI
tara:strand:- start:1072 stop:2100 length:1029 start_codon:yes stop_codon:yes gene_type:complete